MYILIDKGFHMYHRRDLFFKILHFSECKLALKGTQITEEDVKIRFSEILKVNVFFQNPYFNQITCKDPFRKKTLFSRNCDIETTK